MFDWVKKVFGAVVDDFEVFSEVIEEFESSEQKGQKTSLKNKKGFVIGESFVIENKFNPKNKFTPKQQELLNKHIRLTS